MHSLALGIQLVEKIDQRSLAHFKQSILGAVEVRDQKKTTEKASTRGKIARNLRAWANPAW
jgi:hypothetical protein